MITSSLRHERPSWGTSWRRLALACLSHVDGLRRLGGLEHAPPSREQRGLLRAGGDRRAALRQRVAVLPSLRRIGGVAPDRRPAIRIPAVVVAPLDPEAGVVLRGPSVRVGALLVPDHTGVPAPGGSLATPVAHVLFPRHGLVANLAAALAGVVVLPVAPGPLLLRRVSPLHRLAGGVHVVEHLLLGHVPPQRGVLVPEVAPALAHLDLEVVVVRAPRRLESRLQDGQVALVRLGAVLLPTPGQLPAAPPAASLGPRPLVPLAAGVPLLRGRPSPLRHAVVVHVVEDGVVLPGLQAGHPPVLVARGDHLARATRGQERACHAAVEGVVHLPLRAGRVRAGELRLLRADYPRAARLLRRRPLGAVATKTLLPAARCA